MMDKRFIFLFLGFLLILFSGCIQKPSTPKLEIQDQSSLNKTFNPSSNLSEIQANLSSSTPQKLLDECAQNENVLLADDCYLKKAYSSNDISYCSKIYSLQVYDKCLEKFIESNPAVCSNFSSSKLRENCYEFWAYKSNDTNLCLKLSSQESKLKCLKDLSPPCSFEKDESATNLCYALLYDNIKYCKEDESCIIKFAANKKNPEVCLTKNFSQPALFFYCNALALDDPKKCKDTNLTAVSDYCLELFALEKNNSKICFDITSGSIYANRCFKNFAITKNDPNLCSYCAPESQEDDCYKEYSIQTQNYSACEKIASSLVRVECYYKTATYNMRLDICNNLNYRSKKDCYIYVLSSSKQLPNLAVCDQISDEEKEYWLDKCYLKYALDYKDVSTCSKISDPTIKQQCTLALSS